MLVDVLRRRLVRLAGRRWRERRRRHGQRRHDGRRWRGRRHPIDTTSYKGASRKAFSGKVLAIVQSTGAPGQITVTATSSGLTMATATATAQ